MQSSHDPRVLIGVGPWKTIKKLMIRWPSGIVTTKEFLKTDQDYKIIEPKDGVAKPVPGAAEKPAENAKAAAPAKK